MWMKKTVKEVMEKIKERRDWLDLPQKQVADRVKIGRSQYTRYELGTQVMKLDKFLALLDFLDVKAAEVIDCQCTSQKGDPASGRLEGMLIAMTSILKELPLKAQREILQTAEEKHSHYHMQKDKSSQKAFQEASAQMTRKKTKTAKS
jgi:transcriptional regulator with XRE-family HTH domain